MIYEKELCDKVIGCAINVHRTLGASYMEKVYERALLIELEYSGIKAMPQVPINLMYRGIEIGSYLLDIVVENKIVLELKACSKIIPIHTAQLIQYLAASKMKTGYVLNFGSPHQIQFERRSL